MRNKIRFHPITKFLLHPAITLVSLILLFVLIFFLAQACEDSKFQVRVNLLYVRVLKRFTITAGSRRSLSILLIFL